MARKTFDWPAIRRDWETGKYTNAELARYYGCTDTAIRKRVVREGWTRDLVPDVYKRTRQKVVRDTVRANLEAEPGKAHGDDEVVEAVAEHNAGVIKGHRNDIAQARTITQLLLMELHAETTNVELYQGLVEGHITDQQIQGQAAHMLRKAISLPQRATTMKDLSQSLQRLITLERQAHNIDDDGTDEDPLEQVLRAIDGRTKGIDGYGS